jgi:hypothetical protein
MIRLTTQPRPYTAPWHKDGKGPVFMIHAGGVTDREMFEADLAGEYNAGPVTSFEMDAAFSEGLAVLLADSPAQLAELHELRAAEREIVEHNNEVANRAQSLPEPDRADFVKLESRELPAADRQALEEADRIVRDHWPDYAALHRRRARRHAMVPLLAFRQFCSGWTGLKSECDIGPDGLVTEASAKAVPAMDMKAAGYHAYTLLYAVEDEGNSARPSSSEKGPATSTSDAK